MYMYPRVIIIIIIIIITIITIITMLIIIFTIYYYQTFEYIYIYTLYDTIQDLLFLTGKLIFGHRWTSSAFLEGCSLTFQAPTAPPKCADSHMC